MDPEQLWRKHKVNAVSLARQIDTARGTPQDRTRAGDAEREAALYVLGYAFCDGYLTQDEYAARHLEARDARLLSQLEQLTADIPGRPVQVSWAEWFRDAWAVGRDSVYVWLAGVPAGLAVATVPVAVIVTFPGHIGWWKASVIALTIILGLYLVVVSIVGACEADDRK